MQSIKPVTGKVLIVGFDPEEVKISKKMAEHVVFKTPTEIKTLEDLDGVGAILVSTDPKGVSNLDRKKVIDLVSNRKNMSRHVGASHMHLSQIQNVADVSTELDKILKPRELGGMALRQFITNKIEENDRAPDAEKNDDKLARIILGQCKTAQTTLPVSVGNIRQIIASYRRNRQ